MSISNIILGVIILWAWVLALVAMTSDPNEYDEADEKDEGW